MTVEKVTKALVTYTEWVNVPFYRQLTFAFLIFFLYSSSILLDVSSFICFRKVSIGTTFKKLLSISKVKCSSSTFCFQESYIFMYYSCELSFMIGLRSLSPSIHLFAIFLGLLLKNYMYIHMFLEQCFPKNFSSSFSLTL